MSRGLEVSRSELVAKGYTNVRGVWCPPATYEVPTPIATTVRFGTAPNNRPYKSKWESQYATEVLDMELRIKAISWWDYEGMRFRLADGTYYTPDFIVLTSGRLVAREVKGFVREAARVRTNVCARCFPWLRIDIVSRKEGRWQTLEVLNG